MQPLANHIQAFNSPTKQTEQKQLSIAQPKQVALPLMKDHEAKKALSVMLYQCFQTLKLYGKEPEALESCVAMFNMVLADYSYDEIKSAMQFYLKHNNEMPAPADIANIIERGNAPPFDKAVYVSISKKHGEDRTGSEWAYMRDYEQFMITGKN